MEKPVAFVSREARAAGDSDGFEIWQSGQTVTRSNGFQRDANGLYNTDDAGNCSVVVNTGLANAEIEAGTADYLLADIQSTGVVIQAKEANGTPVRHSHKRRHDPGGRTPVLPACGVLRHACGGLPGWR